MSITPYNPARSFIDFSDFSLKREDEELLAMLDAWYLEEEAQTLIGIILNARQQLASIGDTKSTELEAVKLALQDFVDTALTNLDDMRVVALRNADDGSLDTDRMEITSVERAIENSKANHAH